MNTPAGNHHRAVTDGPIQVVIVVAVRLYRDGVGAAFMRAPGFELVAAGANIGDAGALVASHRPDVALLDLSGADACAIVRDVRLAHPRVRIVVLGVEEQAENVIPLLEAGAAGYVTREASLEELLQVARRAVEGEALCSPRVVASLAARLAELSRERADNAALLGLTPREREIVSLLDTGLSNKQIAKQLCIEVATVKNHVHHVLVKLGVERRGAAAAALRQPNASISSARSDSTSANASLA